MLPCSTSEGIPVKRSAQAFIAAVAIVLALAACGQSQTGKPSSAIVYDPSTKVPSDLPPAPSTWPPYPKFSQHSCWTRPFGRGTVPVPMAAAPSHAAPATAHPTAPAVLVKRFVARFGDRSYIRSIRIGALPEMVSKHPRPTWFGSGKTPKDALWAYLTVRHSNALGAPRGQAGNRARMIADWETILVEGALRDDFCAAGGRPLVGWSIDGITMGVSDAPYALGQRFPNPSAQEFRKRVDLVGRRYGFRVVTLKLLRPEQMAPFLIVRTDRPRKAFVHDVGSDPVATQPDHARSTPGSRDLRGLLLRGARRQGPVRQHRVRPAWRGDGRRVVVEPLRLSLRPFGATRRQTLPRQLRLRQTGSRRPPVSRPRRPGRTRSRSRSR